MTHSIDAGAREPRFAFVAGFSHARVPLRLRERYCLRPEDVSRILADARLCAPLAELAVLNTCNRFEAYAVSTRRSLTAGQCLGHIFRMIWPDMPATDFEELVAGAYLFDDEACLLHLVRTASGLDSMVVGEAEIAGQVKDAYRRAHAAGATGPVLNRLFQNALASAKRVRTETGIGRGGLSVGGIAVEVASAACGGDGRGRLAVVCGAGQMGETIARILRKRTAFEIAIANRTHARAEALATALGVRALPLPQLAGTLSAADAVFVAAGAPAHLVAAADVGACLASRAPGRPLVLVDVSVPRGIDPAARGFPGIVLADLEDLGAIAHANEQKRRAHIEDGERLAGACVAEHMPRLLFTMGRGRAPEPAIPIRPAAAP